MKATAVRSPGSTRTSRVSTPSRRRPAMTASPSASSPTHERSSVFAPSRAAATTAVATNPPPSAAYSRMRACPPGATTGEMKR
jgi:hypothetical protein